MQLEEFFEAISFIFIKILPLLGAVLLIYLILMVRHLIICLKSAAQTLDEANHQLRKLDVPLNTVSEISKSVDAVHDMTKESLKSISVSLYESIGALKEWLNHALHKNDKNSESDSKSPLVKEEDIPVSEIVTSKDDE